MKEKIVRKLKIGCVRDNQINLNKTTFNLGTDVDRDGIAGFFDADMDGDGIAESIDLDGDGIVDGFEGLADLLG